MKQYTFVLVVAVVVIGLGTMVFLTTPSLQSSAAKSAAEADLLAETARRQLSQYQPSLSLVEAFLADAEWQAAATEFDAEALAEGVEADPEKVQQIDQVLRDLNAAYDRGQTRVPEGSLELMLEWGFPQAMIEDAFHFAGESGKRESELRRELNTDLPGPSTPRMRGLGPAPEQQSRVLNEAVARVRQKHQANRRLLDEAASSLNEALAVVSDHVAANRLMALVEYQRAMHRRFEGLGLRGAAERLRPRMTELAGNIRRLLADGDAVRDRRNVEQSLQELTDAADALRSDIEEHQAAVARIEQDLNTRRQVVEAKRAEAERLRAAYQQALDAPYDSQDPDAFASHLRAIEEAGRAMSAATAELEAAENGTIEGVQLDQGDDPLDGRYVPEAGRQPEYVRSLAAISRELATGKARLERMIAAAEDIAVRQEQVLKVRDRIAEELTRNEEKIAAVRDELNGLLAECQGIVADAEAAERTAREDHLTKALRYLGAAQRGSASRISQARTAQSEAGGAPAPYLEQKAQERWLGAGLDALEGEVQLLLAAVNLQEVDDLRSHVQVLAAVAEAGAPGVDLQATTEQMEEARFAAAEAAYAAAESFNKAMRSDNQWVYQANVGIALSMLSRIDPTNEEYREGALQALRAVTETRADTAVTGWARVATDRLAALLARMVGEASPEETAEPEAES
ncbi:MAG: hypothetical protein JSU68_03480 [Phycisphaerales bacterium]|nr:MAG: hypothetical protein JSU68_03480 [Phycisphaerales bacterium]